MTCGICTRACFCWPGAVHVVAERLGHADPSITLRVYAHVIRQHAAGIADVFATQVQASIEGAVSKGVSKGAEE